MAEQPLTSQEQLAKEITEALFEQKLIAANKCDKLPQQIAMGLLDTDDWALLIELATEQGVAEKEAGNGLQNNSQNDTVKDND